MGSTRIPTSLKFDDTTDFYNNFIVDMRENKTLATFIVDILRAYYDDEAIRELVNERLNVYDPFTEIKKQIERAQLEHNKTMMSTTVLASQIQSATENLTSGSGSGVSVEDDSAILNRLESLEKVLPSIEDKLNLLLSASVIAPQTSTPVSTTMTGVEESVKQVLLSDTANNNGNDENTPYIKAVEVRNEEPSMVYVENLPPTENTSSVISSEKVLVEEKVVQTEQVLFVSEPVSVQPEPVPIVEVAQVVEPTPVVAPTHIVEPAPIVEVAQVQPTPVVPVFAGAPMFMTEEEEQQQEEETVKKPSSFGKALKSLKK